MTDFVEVVDTITTFVQNERTASFNEGLDVALRAIKDFMRAELRIDPSPADNVPDLLFEIKEHFDRLIPTAGSAGKQP